MLSPGTLVGPYRVVEHVGAEGTMAEVYRAVDESGRTVAVKLLGPSNAQVRREVAVVAGLRYPGIVRTYEVLEQDGRLCLVQEWVEGQSLAAVLDSVGRLDLAETVRLGRSVAFALAYAHGRGLLHRDIKPSNVLRTVEGNYKLVDFGAAGLLEPETGRTMAGQIAGTPLYMSPEQAFGTPQTAASDLFGLGLLLYRCLYGTTPGETAENYLQLITSRTRTPIIVPSSPLQGLLQRCLAVDPTRRPQSAEEVLEELFRIDLGISPEDRAAPPKWDPLGNAPFAWDLPATPTSASPSGWDASQAGPSYKARAVRVQAALVAIIGVVAGLLLAWLLGADVSDVGFWLRVAAGLLVIGVAFPLARRVRRLASRAPETERQAASILTGAGGRAALTRSMVIEVDQVVAKLKGLDATFLGLTMVMLIREAEQAKESADRVAALVQLVTLMEKLVKKLSPWHVRHKDAIATGIAVVGSLVGVASMVSGFLR